jgi:uncharacterized membrane protein YvbJ
MDASGQIYWTCKCGQHVPGDRDCPECGTESTTADTLSGMLRDSIIAELPDPLTSMRNMLRKEDEKRLRKSPRGRRG